MDERELNQRIAAAADSIIVPARPLRPPRATRVPMMLAAAVTVAVLVGAVAFDQQLASWRGTAASTSPAASGAQRNAPSASAGAPVLAVAVDNTDLGYRLRLPAGFRRSE